VSGLSADGFEAKRFADVKAELEASFQNEFGPNVQLQPETYNAQLVGIFADREASLWELAEAVYHAAYLLSAEGAALDDKVAEVGISRLEATHSSLSNTSLADRRVELSGDPTTVVPAGSIFRDPDTLQQWQTTEEGVIGGGGTVLVEAEAIETGPIPGLSGTLTEIVTPVTGWDSVTNPLDAEIGRDDETDSQLRTRYIRSMFVSGGSSADAMVAALIRLDGVTSVANYQNESDITDSDGRPAHSFEVIIEGGDDDEIALTIWQTKPDGIRAYGTGGTAAVATVDIQGNAREVGFTRPTGLDVYVHVEYRSNSKFPDDGEDLILATILEHGLTFIAGQRVYGEDFRTEINVAGISRMTIYVGAAANPTQEELAVGVRQRAVFDSSRVTFEKV
jgi:uncharacterized phage protein gp47/JayE